MEWKTRCRRWSGVAARFAAKWSWVALRALGRWFGVAFWYACLRRPSRFRAPNRLIIAARAVLVLAIALFAIYANCFSLRASDEVFRAFRYCSKRASASIVRFEWVWRKHDIDRYAKEAGERYGVSEALIHAVIEVESNRRVYAISRTGACGLMQIQPTTVEHLKGGNPFDPAENIDMGARYLAEQKRRFKGDTELMLAAYNAGPGVTAKALRVHGGIPQNGETPAYVRRVMRLYRAGVGEGG